MKSIFKIFLIAIFLFSCTHGIDKNRIDNHYTFIERIVEEPEQLYNIVKDSTLIFWYRDSINYDLKFNNLKVSLLKEHINKFFKNGYFISRDNANTFLDIPSKQKYKIHEIAIKSKIANEYFYIEFIQDADSLWKIESIEKLDPYTNFLKRMGK